MDGVTIEKANLDNLENNFDNVAKELTSVADKVSSVNSQISSIDESVNNLTDEVTKLMNEIKETTIINNARQAIMYNNEQIEKKYGYFDILRRKT